MVFYLYRSNKTYNRNYVNTKTATHQEIFIDVQLNWRIATLISLICIIIAKWREILIRKNSTIHLVITIKTKPISVHDGEYKKKNFEHIFPFQIVINNERTESRARKEWETIWQELHLRDGFEDRPGSRLEFIAIGDGSRDPSAAAMISSRSRAKINCRSMRSVSRKIYCSRWK